MVDPMLSRNLRLKISAVSQKRHAAVFVDCNYTGNLMNSYFACVDLIATPVVISNTFQLIHDAIYTC